MEQKELPEYTEFKNRYNQISKELRDILMEATKGIRHEFIMDLTTSIFRGEPLPDTDPYIQAIKFIYNDIFSPISSGDFEEKLLLSCTPKSLPDNKLLGNALIFGITFIHRETQQVLSFFLQENEKDERISLIVFSPDVMNIEGVDILTKVVINPRILSLHDQIMENDLISSQFKD